jgi:hypothetical protein
MVTTCPWCRTRYSSRRNSRGCSAIGLPARSARRVRIGDAQFATVLPHCAPAQQRLDTCEQFGKREGLRKIIITAAAQTPHPLVEARQSAENEHWRGFAEISQGCNNRYAIDAAREHAIEDDDVPMLVRGEIEPAHAVTNQRGGMACLSEAIADTAGRIRFILYDETTHLAAKARRYGCAAPDLGGDEASRIASTRAIAISPYLLEDGRRCQRTDADIRLGLSRNCRSNLDLTAEFDDTVGRDAEELGRIEHIVRH